jgi:probable HAF family extracellular repeat protein
MKHQPALNNMIARHRSSRLRKAWLLFALPAAFECYGIASTQAASFQGLGFLPSGTNSSANAVSADGSTVVGIAVNPAYTSISQQEAFRWTRGGGMVGLGTLTGGTQSGALGVSANGSVVVGNGSSSLGASKAFRWTSGGGMVGLGFLPGGLTSQGNAVSGDGFGRSRTRVDQSVA